jgi:hypothetical protein
VASLKFRRRQGFDYSEVVSEVVSLTERKAISYHFNASNGAVAQLAERVARIHEARGSNPLSSTIQPTRLTSLSIS